MSTWKWLSRDNIYNAVAGLLLIAGCICLVLGLLAALDWRIAPALSLIGAALVLFFAATIERFETLKGLGMEAKIATIDLKITAASQLLAQIKMVAEITGKASISMYARTGRITSIPDPKEMYELLLKVNESLVSIGSSAEVIKDVIEPCTRIMQQDLVRSITKTIAREIALKQDAIIQSVSGQDPTEIEQATIGSAKLEQFRLQLLRGDGSEESTRNLIAILRSAPVSEIQSAAETASELEEFAGSMVLLGQTGRLIDPEKWFARARAAIQ